MTDFRALCEELIEIKDALSGGSVRFSNQGQALDGYSALAAFRDVADRARAALAEQPVTSMDKLDRLIALDRDDPANALAEQLVGPTDEELNALWNEQYGYTGNARVMGLLEFRDAARAVLARWGNHPAKPNSSPADGDVGEFITQLKSYAEYGTPIRLIPFVVARAATLLQQLSAPTPIPVTERLPGPEDCDADGRCWLWERDCGYSGCKWALVDRTWSLSQSDEDLSVYTHWLPANALPLPTDD